LELVLVESSERKSAFLRALVGELELEGARVETRRIRRSADLADLLPCAYLTIRAVRVRDLIRGEGIKMLAPGGRALLFVASREAEDLRLQGIAGLRFIESRPLPSGPNSVLVVMGQADSSS
ncbi:MAG: hypothetical protein ACRDH5_16875, partial [bacterium]